MIKVELTIVVPVFNEEESLPKFREEMDKYLDKTPLSSTILFVNDGSTDNSLQIIKAIVSFDRRYSFISLSKNGGLSTALKAGIDTVNTPFTGYIDSDLQTSPQDFFKYFGYLNHCAMVNGIRKDRHDSVVKKISSKVANGFRRLMINDGIVDTCCPLKIVHTSYLKKMPFFKGMHRFIPALVQLQGGAVHQIEVSHFDRYAGTAKYNLLNRAVGPFFDTLAFLWMKKRNINYTISEASGQYKQKPTSAFIIENE